MKIPQTHLTERNGVQIVGSLIIRELGWLFREQPTSDFGIDAHVELVTGGHADGRMIAAQIKAGSRYFKPETDGGWWFYFEDEHWQYWRSHDLPVIVVLYDPDSGRAYWQVVNPSTATEVGKTYRMLIPSTQSLDASADARLREVAAQPRSRGPVNEEYYRSALLRLPGQVQLRLGQLRRDAQQLDVDEHSLGGSSPVRCVERLAELLARSDSPDATVTRLLENPAVWFPRAKHPLGPGAIAVVASYAAEHGAARTADALVATAESGVEQPGRWRALAGLQLLLSGDRHAAAAALRLAADEPGGALLASIGQASMEAPAGVPVPVPADVQAKVRAAASDVMGDPVVLRFLGDERAAAGDYSSAIAWYTAALRAAPEATSTQITLAHLQLQRAGHGSSPVYPLDITQAERLAESARADRRAWGGHSAPAALELVMARLAQQDYEAAMRAALAAPDGEATSDEAAWEPLALQAVRIAARTGNVTASDASRRHVKSAGAVAQLAALDAQVSEAAPDDQPTAWRAAADAAENDQQRAIALHNLAGLGVWAQDVADDLRTRGALTEDRNDIVRAQVLRAKGDFDRAITLLRAWEPRSSAAAEELAFALRETDPRRALETCDRAANRFGDLSFRLLALDIERGAGGPEAAVQRALRVLVRPDLPQPLRDQLHDLVFAGAAAARDWELAEEQATLGLMEHVSRLDLSLGAASESPPKLTGAATAFAWAVIGARYNGRRLDDAGRALAQLEPPIRSVTDANLWLSLTKRMGWTPEAVGTALDLAELYFDDEVFVSRLLGSLLTLDAAETSGSVRDHPSPTARKSLLNAARSQRLQGLLTRHNEEHRQADLQAVQLDAKGLLDRVRDQLAPRATQVAAARAFVEAGLAPLGVLASVTGRPYMQALIQRAAGQLYAVTSGTTQRVRERAALQTGLGRAVVADPSALAVATLLGARWPQLRASFARVMFPRIAAEDVENGLIAVRGQIQSAFTIGVTDDGNALTRTELDPGQRTYLTNRVTAVGSALADLDIIEVETLDRIDAAMRGEGPEHRVFETSVDGAWLGALELALERTCPMWADDAVLRVIAHEAGIPAFGTYDLLQHLATVEEWDLDSAVQKLISEFVVDIDWTADQLVRRAEADRFQPAAAATALMQSGPWDSQPMRAAGAFLTIIAGAAKAAPDTLSTWVFAASTGRASTGGTAADVEALVARIVAMTILRILPEDSLVNAAWTGGVRGAETALSRIATRLRFQGSDHEAAQLTLSQERLRALLDDELTAALRQQMHGCLSEDGARRRSQALLATVDVDEPHLAE